MVNDTRRSNGFQVEVFMKFSILINEMPTPHINGDITYYYEMEIFFYNVISEKAHYADIVKWHEKNIKHSHLFRSSSFSVCIYYTNLEDAMAFKLWFL